MSLSVQGFQVAAKGLLYFPYLKHICIKSIEYHLGHNTGSRGRGGGGRPLAENLY